MKLQFHHITVPELVEDHADDDEDGVVRFGSMLNVHPLYQREFV